MKTGQRNKWKYDNFPTEMPMCQGSRPDVICLNQAIITIPDGPGGNTKHFCSRCLKHYSEKNRIPKVGTTRIMKIAGHEVKVWFVDPATLQ